MNIPTNGQTLEQRVERLERLVERLDATVSRNGEPEENAWLGLAGIFPPEDEAAFRAAIEEHRRQVDEQDRLYYGDPDEDRNP